MIFRYDQPFYASFLFGQVVISEPEPIENCCGSNALVASNENPEARYFKFPRESGGKSVERVSVFHGCGRTNC